MGEFINNDDMMQKSGKDLLSNVFKTEEENYQALKKSKEIDKILDNDSVDTSSENVQTTYNKMIDESDDAGTVKRFSKTFGGMSNYLNARKYVKYNNLSTQNALNKNYVMPLDEKGLKKLKGKMDEAKKTTGLFDKIHEQTKKYAIWMLILCALLPFAIPAMLAVGAVILAEYAVHEAVCQYEYNKVIKPLTVNGKNPYKHMLYSKGYKKLDELTAKQYKAEDVLKALIEAKENEKDPKKKEDLAKAIAKYVADNNIELSAEQNAKIGNAETNEIKGEQKQAESVKEETVESGKTEEGNEETPFSQDEKTKEALNEENTEIVSQENIEPANEGKVEGADIEKGREQEFKEPTPHTEGEAISESFEKDNSTKQTRIEEFDGKSKDDEGIVSGEVTQKEDEEQEEPIKDSNSDETNQVNEVIDDNQTQTFESPFQTNEKLVDENPFREETSKEDDNVVTDEQSKETEQPQDIKQPTINELNEYNGATEVDEQPQVVDVNEEQSKDVNSDSVEEYRVVDEENSEERINALNQEYKDCSTLLWNILKTRGKNGNNMAKNDSALLEKIDKIFVCAGNSASIAESYIVILKMAIGRYNENPNTEKLFDGSAIVNTEDAYSEIFGTKPKLSAEKAKEEKEAMDAQKAKFDNMYQYTYAIINRRYVELHNEQSERDLNALKSLKNSYDFCFSKGQYNLCKTLNNIASYIGMTTSEMVEKQGCFFTKEILNDLKLINSNIQIAINISKQRTQQNLDESKEKSI